MGDFAIKASPKRTFWWSCSCLVDAFTICVSIADIVTDVLVLLEFKRLGYAHFFIASAAIFVISQVSYAFLFAATFASHRAPWTRCAVFLAALPFGQLVPLFTWLEALHLPSVDHALRRLGLQPTADGYARITADSDDSLWGFLQSKYQSHAGFLVEAFVEAVPQAVLQTVFVVIANHGTALNAASVGISIFTVASKGYLVSFALDHLTFVFNFGCIVADCLGLFAIVTAISMQGLHGFLARAISYVSASGLIFCVLGGHALLWFTITDDHLKLRDCSHWPGGIRGVSSIFFDLYLVRLVGWFLAIIPCIVLFAGARLSLIPVLVLRSVDPDLVRHARFFRGLVHFLSGEGGGSKDRRLRLWAANTFISQARRETNRLERQLMCRKQGVTLSQVVLQWSQEVGMPKAKVFFPWRRPVAPHTGEIEEDATMQHAIMESLSSAPGEGGGFVDMATLGFRRLRAVVWFQTTLNRILAGLQAKSEIFRPGCVSRSSSELSKRPTSVALRGIAIFALVTVLVCALPLLAGHAVLIALSLVFPLLHVLSNCAIPWPAPCPEAACVEDDAIARVALPCGLGITYCVVLACMSVLAPVVARKQLVWIDLLDVHDFPDPFYGGAVLVEIRKRHLRDSMLRSRLGHYLAGHVLGFLET
eukprot:TRINITY_DN12170_c0_g1_i2.p1 TRINITY_DN12170_c0_g1~~TRINITY_DN12170_c0_g1_i2.p1  ORF type:complete len:648 (-),score=78.67 TRINITY_DN12170_c0_g1_i2:185-2128(-)